MRITARYTFEAAHRLHDAARSDEQNERLYGPCAQVHGHTYRLEVVIAGDRLDHGMLINFVDLDTIVNQLIVGRLDHSRIDDIPHFSDVPSTAEEIARWAWGELDAGLESAPGELAAVTVWEGDRFSATVTREDNL